MQGTIVSAIAGAIDAVVSAIASIIMIIVSVIATVSGLKMPLEENYLPLVP